MVYSNEHGRALEYKVTEELAKFLKKNAKNFEITPRTEAQNAKQKAYFDALTPGMQQDFEECANSFVEWVKFEKWVQGADKVVLDRIPDNEAKDKAGVADIEIIVSKGGKQDIKKVSVKHRHNALRHPRLPSLAQQCGIESKEINKHSQINVIFMYIKRSFINVDCITLKEISMYCDVY